MKRSVLTITLNPSLDKSSSVENIVPEKKLRCSSPKHEPGGGGINVSRALKRLGINSTTFFTSGGSTGIMLEELLKLEELNIETIRVNGATRENLAVVETSTNQQYRFGFPGQPIKAEEQQKILDFAEYFHPLPDYVVISGSLPSGVQAQFISLLISMYKLKGSRVVVDTSGDSLKAAVEEGVFLLKPNLGELASLVGKDALEDADVDAAAKAIIAQGKASLVIVSLGARGAILYSENEKIQMAPPVVKVRSIVGAGDSMVAGILSVLVKQGPIDEILRMGIACGSATTMAEGSALFAKKDVDRLLNKIRQVF
jgi:6-phosphofructokinase 2